MRPLAIPGCASRDATGALTSRHLLTGSGYGAGAEAQATAEFHADGGVVRHQYDQFGDLRVSIDAIGRRTAMTYDTLGRVVRQDHADGMWESFGYDALGQRLWHANSALPGERETTDYDFQGRVVSTRAFGGDVTTTRYAWTGDLVTTGMGSFGGWTEVTTLANGFGTSEATDMFGHVVASGETAGGGAYDIAMTTYDLGGRMTQRAAVGETVDYGWLNTGLLATQASDLGSGYERAVSTYGYDAAGRKVAERFVRDGVTWQQADVTYDALGRMTGWSQAATAQPWAQPWALPTATMAWQYDAVGNIRHTVSTQATLTPQGATGASRTEDRWYRFDTMGRVTLDGGTLVNGTLVRGGGTTLTYDLAGQRTSATRDAYLVGQVIVYVIRDYESYPEVQDRSYQGERRETFGWRADGQLASVAIAETGYDDDGLGNAVPNGLFTRAGGSAAYSYDAAGRQTRQVDRDAYGTAVYDRSATLDAAGRVASETVVQRQGTDTLRSVTTYDYGTGAGYALGQAVGASVASWKIVGAQNQYQGTTTTTNVYTASSAPRLASSTTRTVPASGSATNAFTTYAYDGGGRLETVTLADGRPRTVTFVSDLSGQALRRDEADGNTATGDPHEVWYRFGGHAIGHVGNDAGAASDYAGSIQQRGQAPAATPGAFGNAPRYAQDFATSVDTITSYDQGSDSGSYTVRSGDTLGSIAAATWGDAGLWYKLAQANGLTADTQLTAGTTLRLPAGIVRSSYNAAQFRPYDPADALGDVTPVTATPAAKAKKNKCGAFGKILLVVVAVAVTIATSGAAVAAASGAVHSIGAGIATVLGTSSAVAGVSTGLLVGAGIAGGVVGSAVSQGVGLATGIQDKFSWKGVALAGMAGGIGGGLAGSFAKVGGSAFLGSAVRGAVSNLLTQGAAIATGLQSKFDWVGAAVGAAVAAGAGAAGRGLAKAGLGRFGTNLTSNMAGALAGGAARSLLDGSDFGDNVLAALPDVIGATIGQMVGDRLVGMGRSGSGMSPVERALVAEAQQSANPAAGTGGSQMAAVSGSRAANGADAQADDIVVIANKYTLDLFRNMTSYQFGRYTSAAGDRSYYPTALWASRLASPQGGYDMGAFLRQDSTSLRSLTASMSGRYNDRSYSVGGVDYISKAAARQAGVSFISTPTRSYGLTFAQQQAVQAAKTGGFLQAMAITAAQARGAGFSEIMARGQIGAGADDLLLGIGGMRGVGKPYLGNQLEMTVINGENGIHANSRLSGRTTYLYELQTRSGEFLKYGISVNPEARYPRSFTVGKDIFRITSGTRADMLALEKQMVISNPGPLNNESWAVKAREGK